MCLLLLQVLIPKVKEQDPNPNVVINIMAAIGELAQVGVARLGVVVINRVPLCKFLSVCFRYFCFGMLSYVWMNLCVLLVIGYRRE